MVVTEVKATKEQRHFDVVSATPLPSGAMVLDDDNNLVCVISLKNQCLSVPLQQAVLTRELMQYDSNDEVVAAYMPEIITGTAIIVVVAGASGTFYLMTFLRARYLGIPAAVFWKAMCSYGYCAGWSVLSSIQCALGIGCCPCTYGYSAACCWTAPLTAAWNWIDLQARRPIGTYVTLPDQEAFLSPEHMATPPHESSPSVPEVIVQY